MAREQLRRFEAYNPLNKAHLGESVAEALLKQRVHTLPPPFRFGGSGIYAIYYRGSHGLYSLIASQNLNGKWSVPIYVGKAVPKGARQGKDREDSNHGTALMTRLRVHSRSIKATGSLKLEDFACRFLVVDDVWIPLGESLLIKMFSPIWNTALDGFGNNKPGKNRKNQERSYWDTTHPGREWAKDCTANSRSLDEITSEVRESIADAYGSDGEQEYTE